MGIHARPDVAEAPSREDRNPRGQRCARRSPTSQRAGFRVLSVNEKDNSGGRGDVTLIRMPLGPNELLLSLRGDDRDSRDLWDGRFGEPGLIWMVSR